jgi:tetratricopeptide (TPR) repeat protein
MKVAQFIILFIFTSGPSFALELEEELKLIREYYQNANEDNQSNYEIWLASARELMILGQVKEAHELLAKARNQFATQDFTPLFIEDLNIRLQMTPSTVAALKTEVDQYYKDRPALKSEEAGVLIELINAIENPTKKVPELYSGFINEKRIQTLIESKKYEEALNLYNYESVKDSDIVTKIHYDLVSTLAHTSKAQPEKLLCFETARNHPESYSYSVKLCQSIIHFLKSGSHNQEKLKELQSLLKEDHPQKMYLYHALTDLKN